MTEVVHAEAPVPAASRIEHFPVSFFATVMGTAGLAIATHRLETTLGLPSIASGTIGTVAATFFVVIAAFYLVKCATRPAAVVAEWRHPVRLSFFPAISISLLLLSILALPIDRAVAEIVWALGAALHLCFGLAIISTWIGSRPFETPTLGPAWFIPAVGNIIVPLTGVPLGYTEVSWFFFSFGLMFWLILATLVFNRLIFHHPLPDRLLPTLMILVAPPAVGFLSYMKLNGGHLDGIARFFFHAGLALFLLVATRAAHLVKIRFALSWWAYSFPLAALTTASSVFADAVGSRALTGVFFVLYALLAGLLVVLITATVRAIVAGEICRPEH